MHESDPVPVLTLTDPEQFKAFTDPLRSRLLQELTRRAATNQQLADLLGEPQAKVLHHLRVLLGLELIRLVETRVRGGNVEKYYRAIARTFRLRAGNESVAEMIAADIDLLREYILAGADDPEAAQPYFITMFGRLNPTRELELRNRLSALIVEYLDQHEDPDGEPVHFFGVLIHTAEASPSGGQES